MTTQDYSMKNKREQINREIEQLKKEDRERRIHKYSPEGRPANPLLLLKDTLWLIVGSVIAVIAISIASYFVWSLPVALLIFALGTAFAVLANPVIWAGILRASERDSIARDDLDELE
jgi:hypothetical protein